MVVLDERATLHQSVAALAPEIRERALETETLRAVPADLMARIKAAGLCRLALPQALGGFELDPMTVVELIEDLSYADGSTGWTTLIGNATSFMAWLDPAVALDLIGDDPNISSTSMFGPLGTGIEEGDDVIVSGRWPFSSGSPNADLIQVGIFVMDGDQPRLRPDGLPDWRFVYLRKADVVIEDTWHAAGLRGTGSNDVVLTKVRVPARQTAMPVIDIAPHDGPLWRLPFFALARTIMIGFPLGVARRALDEIEALAPTKRRPMSPITLAEDPVARVEIAQAEAGLQAARAFVFDALDEIWSVALSGDRPGERYDQRVKLASQQAMRSAVDAVDCAFHLGGAGAVYETQPLQRCFRDVHAANQHIIFSNANWADYGRYAFAV
jgi:alkylation response protein AidB-like acyl-CoA dehydrogenase